MYSLRGSDRREVAVSLICKDDVVGMSALYAGGYRRSASVRGFNHIALEVIICEYRAADRRDADRFAADIELVERLGDQTMHDSVRTARAIVERHG